ncbi:MULTISPECIES: sigma-E processing peptidase SpoIIGA [Bacillus]|uniref:sigma-E processing peptidase SpoIIGA n=1 Tax=Bacillus TaxID=1386 RepID=UPI000310F8D6|nr:MULTISPECIES: sigma-E processing peptidase SpoIIGA [Bacillus]
MVAYLDLIVLLNGCFDCLLLYWTSILLKRKVTYKRIFLGGLLGSLLIVFSFSPYYYLGNSVIVKILCSLLMVWIVFGYVRLKLFLKSVLTFYMITFLSGGILIGIHFLFAYKFIAEDTGFFYTTKSYGDPVSWLFVMIGFPLAWIYSKKVFSDMEMDQVLHKEIVDVMIKIKDHTISCKGLIDTGNALYEPITNIPVMIFSISNFLKEIPEDVVKLVIDSASEEFLSSHLYCSWGERLRVIPYKVVGNEQQLMVAFRPDWIQIVQGNQKGLVEKGLVGLTLQTLSHDGQYHCIVHPRMMISLQNQNVS